MENVAEDGPGVGALPERPSMFPAMTLRGACGGGRGPGEPYGAQFPRSVGEGCPGCGGTCAKRAGPIGMPVGDGEYGEYARPRRGARMRPSPTTCPPSGALSRRSGSMCASSSRAAISDGESRALLGPGVPGGIGALSRRGVTSRCMRLRLSPFCDQSSGGSPPRGALIGRAIDAGGGGGGIASAPARAGEREV